MTCTQKKQTGFLLLVAMTLAATPMLLAQQFLFRADQTAGTGDAIVEIEIVNAAETTGDAYQVTFALAGQALVFSVENTANQSVLAANVPVGTTSAEFEGISVTVLPPPPAIKAVTEVQFGETAVAPPVHVYRPGDRQGRGGPNSTGEYTFVAGNGGGFDSIARREANAAPFDYELRFDGNPDGRNKLIYAFTGEGTIDVPFSVWNIGIGTPDDASDDHQIMAVGFDDSGNPGVYDGGLDASDGGVGRMFDRIYFREFFEGDPAGDINGDGNVDYNDMLQDLQNAGGDLSPTLFSRPYVGPEVVSRFSMVSIAGDDNYTPPAGTTIRITTTKPASEQDVFTFTSPEFGLYTRPVALDFGETGLAIIALTRFTVGNRSNNAITVTDISFDAAQFSADQTAFSIPANDSTTISISFETQTLGRIDATMTIISDDVFFPEYRIAVSGKGSNLSISQVGHFDIPGGGLTDVWGYVDSTGAEYALVGSSAGLNIIGLADPANPELLAQVTDVPGFDVKAWRHYAYTVGGGFGGIVDLSDPRNPQAVGTFPSAHNITIADNGFMYSECPGLRIFDLNQDPLNPVQVFNDGGAECHDATVVGDILFDFQGGTGLTNIYNVSAPTDPQFLGAAGGPEIAYNHSGWPSKNGDYLFICDELADFNGKPFDLTVWDIRDLDNPVQVGDFADDNATIHNLFVIGDFAFVAYYTAGFRIFDVTDPPNPVLFDEFDTSPAEGSGFGGAFGVYPFLPSGNILVSDGGTGLHVFKFTNPITSVAGDHASTPTSFALGNNYPNPFNPMTLITYELPRQAEIRLEIFNSLGQKIRTLVDAVRSAGSHNVVWDGADEAGVRVASGAYFYRIKAADFAQTRRMLLLK